MHLTVTRKFVFTGGYRVCGSPLFIGTQMKEFGLYVIKQNYIDKFSLVDESIKGLKGNVRPFLCVKVTVDKLNWLLPIASLNPSSPDYKRKLSKYSDFLNLDREQAKKDNKPYARAITLFKDLTGLQANPDYRSIVEYYNAIPIKHKYCRKFRDKNKKHIVIQDEKIRTIIKKSAIENISAMMKGEKVGFIKAKIDNGKTSFSTFSKKSIEIFNELYKEHIALQAAEKERARRSEEQKQLAAHRKELKNQARSKIIVAIEPLRIFGRTGNGDVFTKIPGKNPEDMKTKITLPKTDVAIDKDGQHIIGITAELQKRYNFKLSGGQPRRILK